jgi:hypothetical protein
VKHKVSDQSGYFENTYISVYLLFLYFIIFNTWRRQNSEKAVWKAERALRGAKRRSNPSKRSRRAKPGTVPLLLICGPPQISWGRRGGVSPRSQGASPRRGGREPRWNRGDRRKGESEAVPPPSSRWVKSGVPSNHSA